VYWRAWPIHIGLPDFGAGLYGELAKLKQSQPSQARATHRQPGRMDSNRAELKAVHPVKFDVEFVAPAERPDFKPAIWHEPACVRVSGLDLPIQLTVAAPRGSRRSGAISLPHRRVLARANAALGPGLRVLRSPTRSGATSRGTGLPIPAGIKELCVLVSGGKTGASPEAGSAEQQRQSYSTTILDVAALIRLLWGDEHSRVDGQSAHREDVINGESGPAWRVSAPGFGGPPPCVSWRVELSEKLRPWQ
jgi:hypothetical protein